METSSLSCRYAKGAYSGGYEPDINPTYLEMAQHYGVTVIPARPRRPKDKAKVEGARALRAFTIRLARSQAPRSPPSQMLAACDARARNDARSAHAGRRDHEAGEPEQPHRRLVVARVPE
jgi:transposase